MSSDCDKRFPFNILSLSDCEEKGGTGSQRTKRWHDVEKESTMTANDDVQGGKHTAVLGVRSEGKTSGGAKKANLRHAITRTTLSSCATQRRHKSKM